MNSRLNITVLACAVFTLASACSSAPATPGGNMLIDSANAQLAKVPITGFPPNVSSMTVTQFDQYGEGAATVAKGVVASMPPNYALQVTGHATPGRSAEFASAISTKRAKYVHNYLVQKGLDGSKMTAVGVGTSEPDPNLSEKENRRVTFRLVERK